MKGTYLERLAWSARWRLPPAEAREMLEDYEAMLAEEPRSEEVLYQEVGTPKEAVGALVEPREYLRWLVVFGGLTACLLLLVLSAAPGLVPAVGNYFHRSYYALHIPTLLLTAGSAGALLWFRGQGPREPRRPRGLLPLLLLQLAGLAGVWVPIGLMLSGALLRMHVSYEGGVLLRGVLSWGGVLLALLGFVGLVWARMAERRWAAAYILGLTVIALATAFLALLGSLNLEGFGPGWWEPFLTEYLFITVVGLVGTGVSLC